MQVFFKNKYFSTLSLVKLLTSIFTCIGVKFNTAVSVLRLKEGSCVLCLPLCIGILISSVSAISHFQLTMFYTSLHRSTLYKGLSGDLPDLSVLQVSRGSKDKVTCTG